MSERGGFDLDSYVERTLNGPCFICGIVEEKPDFFHHIVYEDEKTVAFLDKYPTLYGQTLVAPREHKTRVTGDFTVNEYADFQRIVHAASEAVREEAGAERVYLLSLGSNEGNAHVHWHIAPLPSGVPYEKQQFAAIMVETAGVLNMTDDQEASLAAGIRWRIKRKIEGGTL